MSSFKTVQFKGDKLSYLQPIIPAEAGSEKNPPEYKEACYQEPST